MATVLLGWNAVRRVMANTSTCCDSCVILLPATLTLGPALCHAHVSHQKCQNGHGGSWFQLVNKGRRSVF